MKFIHHIKESFWASNNVKALGFTLAVTTVGVAALLMTNAATPYAGLETEGGLLGGNAQKITSDSSASGNGYIRFGQPPPDVGTVAFRLFAPGWRPMASGKQAAINKADKFKEIIDGNYYDPAETDPKKREKAIDPADLQAKGARVYNYTLGPYVTNRYVPCDLIPSTHPEYANYQATCLKADGSNKPNDFPAGMTIDEWSKVIARENYNGTSQTHACYPGTVTNPTPLLSVYACRFDNNFLIYPNSLPWISYLKNELISDALQYGGVDKYDGVFADSVGSNPADPDSGYLNLHPLKPANNNTLPVVGNPLYSIDSWLTASKESLEAREEKLTSLGKSLTLNGLETGTDYWDGCSALQAASGVCLVSANSNRKLLVPRLHGAMSESIFRAAGAGINSWDNSTYAERWRKDVEMIRDVQSKGIKGYWWVKCWTGTDYSCDDENQAQVVQWRRLVIASYLLGAGDKSYLNFDTKRDDHDSAEYFSDYDQATAVGTTYSNSQYTQIGATGAFQRIFSNGIVLVNPTRGSITVNIPAGSYKKFGSSVATTMSSITLPGGTGEVLVN